MFFISAATGAGFKEMLLEVWQLLKASREEEKKTQAAKTKSDAEDAEYRVFRPHLESPKSCRIEKLSSTREAKRSVHTFKITGKRIEQVATMTDVSQPDGLLHLRHYLKALGIQRALVREGAKAGDTLIIGLREIFFQIVQ